MKFKNETPRRKQRGIYFASKIYSVASHGEFNPCSRIKFHYLFCWLLCGLLTACGQQDAPESNTAQSESADQATAEQVAKVTEDRDAAKHFVVGTGSVQGVYFPIGGVICRLVNRHKEQHKVRCSVESTSGSVSNMKEVRKGHFDLALAQSDWQYHAYNGTSIFEKEGANDQLRAVFALEPDPLALVVRSDSEIAQFDDLQDKVISFGYTRSLQHRIISDFLKVKEWGEDRFKSVIQISDKKQLASLCAGDIDSALFLSSSLREHVDHAQELCDLKLVSIEGSDVKKVIVEKPYYRTGIIRQRYYFDSKEDIQSFGLGATFVASAQTSPKAIYHVVKEVVENFKDFQSLHSSLETLSINELPYAGITAPLHPGAIRYFKEARLIK